MGMLMRLYILPEHIMGERLLVLLVHLTGRKNVFMGPLVATNKTQCLQHVQ